MSLPLPAESGFAARNRFRVRASVCPTTSMRLVGSIAAIERIIAAIADDDIVAIHPGDDVVSASSVQDVLAGVPGDRIAKRRSIGTLDCDKGVGTVTCRRPRGQVNGHRAWRDEELHPVRTARSVDGVVPAVALEEVFLTVSGDRVVEVRPPGLLDGLKGVGPLAVRRAGGQVEQRGSAGGLPGDRLGQLRA